MNFFFFVTSFGWNKRNQSYIRKKLKKSSEVQNLPSNEKTIIHWIIISLYTNYTNKAKKILTFFFPLLPRSKVLGFFLITLLLCFIIVMFIPKKNRQNPISHGGCGEIAFYNGLTYFKNKNLSLTFTIHVVILWPNILEIGSNFRSFFFVFFY